MTTTDVFIVPFAVAAGMSLLLTPWVKRLAFRLRAVDQPGDPRRIHKTPTARLGGVAIYLAIVVPTVLYLGISRQIIGLLLACTVLVLVGVVDDIRGLNPFVKLGWQILAACLALAGGIGITAISNPLGGIIDLQWGKFAVDLGEIHFNVIPIANILSILWMVGMVNVVNFSDGLDGLATGVSGIAALALFVISVRIGQTGTAMLALIVAGACFGFLPYNFNPARIFLGDSGAYTLGIVIAMLAIYSGSKLATAALVMGFPILDGVWTVLRRLHRGVSPFKADRLHLHHMMIDAGLHQRMAVLILYALAAVFSLVAVSTDSRFKLIALVSLTVILALMLGTLAHVQRRSKRKH